MISVVAKCGASGAPGCCVIQPSYEWTKLKNLQCCLAGRHVKCGNVSLKQ